MSQNRDAPAFQCYASNIIADKRYRLMSPMERFTWVSIYLECWPNGSVPADPEELAKYLGYPIEDIKAGLTEKVLSFFKEVKGELISPELDAYREKLLSRNKRKSDGGKKGAKRRWDKDTEDIGQPIGAAIGQPIGNPMGSLIQSNLNQSNQIQSLVKEPIQDQWLAEYEAASNESIATPNRVRRTV